MGGPPNRVPPGKKPPPAEGSVRYSRRRDATDTEHLYRRTAALNQNKNLQSAKGTLFGSTRAPLPTEETAAAVDELVAMPVTQQELKGQAEDIQRIQKLKLPWVLPPDTLLRQRIQYLTFRPLWPPSGARNYIWRAVGGWDTPFGSA